MFFSLPDRLAPPAILNTAMKEGVEAKYDFFLSRNTARNRLLPGFNRGRVANGGEGIYISNPRGFSRWFLSRINKGRHYLGGGFNFLI